MKQFARLITILLGAALTFCGACKTTKPDAAASPDTAADSVAHSDTTAVVASDLDNDAPFPPPSDSSAAAPVSTAGTKTHTIAKGDTLYRIAKDNGVTVRQLELANPGIEATLLRIGQVIAIPAAE